MEIARPIALAFATALATYAVLLASAMIPVLASGDGVSCDTGCSAWTDWLNDAAPWPMVAAVALAIISGLVVGRRARRP